VTEEFINCIRSHSDTHTRLDRTPDRLFNRPLIRQDLLVISLGPAELLGVLHVPDVVIDGRNVDDLLPNHLGECGVINIYRVLKRISARSDRIAGSLGPVTVNCNALPHRMSCPDGSLHLFESECLMCLNVVKPAGGSKHLDEVHPSINFLPHQSNDFRHSRGLVLQRNCPREDFPIPWYRAARHHGRSGNKHPGSDHCASIDQVAHSDVAVVSGRHIAHRCHTDLNALAGVLLCQKYQFLRQHTCDFRVRVLSRVFVPPVCQVRVHVNHSGHSRICGQIDHLRTIRYLGFRIANAVDATALDDDHSIRYDPAGAVDQFAESNRFDSLSVRLGAQRRNWPTHDYQKQQCLRRAHRHFLLDIFS